ncbi:hypothetical protein [Lactiplantibacillus plantarum]|uniref:hypothetical protein n=1 Tax=Lactiplantibacillus plantarum TaxID=1590 RepID=UPI001B6AEFCF|nr:hypothetical protein [Lactiplantibacillus plantarum]
MKTQLTINNDDVVTIKNVSLSLANIILIITELNRIGFQQVKLKAVNVINQE